ncbi:hypothetical protein GGX14DRAFT_693062 [Mycena pura]|uniref:HMG box domain-containing protein n=1 Tax=Mycena pura TaxID=153505 RepID=A0AAD6YR57_9AGAR|nr:hypothetical protein GGX14DRAFT_693062 [Mycena pura]
MAAGPRTNHWCTDAPPWNGSPLQPNTTTHSLNDEFYPSPYSIHSGHTSSVPGWNAAAHPLEGPITVHATPGATAYNIDNLYSYNLLGLSSLPNDEYHTAPFSSYSTPLQPVAALRGTAGGPEERRPRRGDDDYVPRPPNAFILYRSERCKKMDPSGKKKRQVVLNGIISQEWRELSEEDRAVWEGRAKVKKLEHGIRYPDYVYRPQRRNAKKSVSAVETAVSGSPTTSYRRNHSSSQHRGGSTNAPTASPYQASQIASMPHGMVLESQRELSFTGAALENEMYGMEQGMGWGGAPALMDFEDMNFGDSRAF